MYLVLLDCTHYLRFRTKNRANLPRLSDVVWCMSCDKGSEVIGIKGPWRTFCLDCDTKSPFVEREVTARGFASGHQRSFPQHRMRLYQVGRERHGMILAAVEPGGQTRLF